MLTSNGLAGSFSQDSRGRWYFNIVVEAAQIASQATGQVGIDLGLKEVATCSNGLKLESKQFYRRADAIHKFTTQLVREHSFIVVGNVNSSQLAKTKMAKSVLDAGWYILKTQLDYKSKAMQGVFIEVNES